MPAYADLVKYPVSADRYNTSYGETQWWRDLAVTVAQALREKAALGHTHDLEQVVGLEGALDGKASQGDVVEAVESALAGVASAYDVAVERGYLGDMDQWLASLRGPRGEEGPYGGTAVVDPQLASLILDASETRDALRTSLTTTGTRPVGKGELMLSAADYRQEGRTEQETLRLAGIASSSSGRQLSIEGTWNVGGNIAGFWNAFPAGTGKIIRSGITFHVGPRPTYSEVPVNNIYVNSETGGDGNDGLTPWHPFQTLQAVYRHVLRRLTPQQAAGAKWVIHCRGTLAPPPQMSELPDFPLGLTFDGGPLAGGETVPEGGRPQTKLVQGTGGSSLIIGLWFEPGIRKVIVKRLGFEGFAIGFNGYGVIMKGGGYLELEDCVAVGNDCGFSVVNNVMAYIRRCLATNGMTGFRAHYMSAVTWNDCEARDNSGQGFGASRAAVTHLDFSRSSGNTNGLAVNMQARVAVVGGRHVRNSQYGVRVEGAGEWSNHTDFPVDYGVGTSDENGIAPFAHFGVGREVLQGQRATNQMRTYTDQSVTTETGFTGNRSVRAGLDAVFVDHFISDTKKLEVKVTGTLFAADNYRELTLILVGRDGLSPVNAVRAGHSPASTDVPFELWATFIPGGGTQVKYSFTFNRSGYDPLVGNGTVAYTNGRDISPRLSIRHDATSERTQIRSFECFFQG